MPFIKQNQNIFLHCKVIHFPLNPQIECLIMLKIKFLTKYTNFC